MTTVLESVDSRTNMVGQNRLELLLFGLKGKQQYAINVFKVQEVLKMPKVNRMPNGPSALLGMTQLRGVAIPIIDLSSAIGFGPLDSYEDATVIVAEYNSNVQAFVVDSVDVIINLDWQDMAPPPSAVGNDHYLTAITQVKDEIVSVIDVEKVLSEISPNTEVSLNDHATQELNEIIRGMDILVVDDSTTAHQQISGLLNNFEVNVHQCMNGQEALEWISSNIQSTDDASNLLMVITDAEMPVIDGYRLTSEIRLNEFLKKTYVVMNTSLSGQFNDAMSEKVGCNELISKFDPVRLRKAVESANQHNNCH